jgi:hypothetical protein
MSPLEYRIDPVREIVTITGEYSDAAGWRTLLSAVSRDPAYRRGFGFIRDLRGSTHPVDAATVMEIIDVVKEFWSVLGVRRAAIVMGQRNDDPALVAHALAEQQHLPLRAFTYYDDAVKWVRERDPPTTQRTPN